MNKSLIIALDQQPILEISHFVAERKRKNATEELYLLTYKHNKVLGHLIPGIKRVYVIDQEKIQNLLHNKLYSNGFALNNFFNNLQMVFNTSWDSVINLSTNKLSQYLSSAIEGNNIIGGYINQNGHLNYSSIWAALSAEIFPQLTLYPIKTLQTNLRAAGMTIQSSGIKITTNEKNNEIAFKNINKIRNAENTAEEARVIGITITEKENSLLTIQHLEELLDQLFSTSNLIPLLILKAKNREQQKIVNHLNQSFDNSLLSVESDEIALPSLLMNIDLLITDSSFYRSCANLVETPTIQINKSIDQLFRDYSMHTGDLHLLLDSQFKTTTLVNLTRQILENQTPELSEGDNSELFQIFEDTHGPFPQLLVGEKYRMAIITALIQRYYITSQQKNSDNTILLNYIFKTFGDELPNWSHIQKNALMKNMQLLLKTLRHLLQAKKDRKSGNQFLLALDELLESNHPSFITSIPLSIFEFNVNKLDSATPEENMLLMEHLIYDLKNSFRKVMTTLSLIESKHRSIGKKQHKEEINGRA